MEKVTLRCVLLRCAMLLLWDGAWSYNLDTRFPIIYGSSPGNYFGYTVALHRNRDGPLALVGAPRANSTVLVDQVHQPGVLFRCNIPNNPKQASCREVTLFTKGNTHTDLGSEFSYYDKKDDMWLGVSLDVQQDSTQSDIVTCGHLWKNQYYRQHHLANGVCYVINSDLDPSSVKKLVPLIQRSKQAIIPPGIYYYAFGQAGTSAAYSEDGKNLILGAPGIYDWIGSVVSYPSDSKDPKVIYKNPAIPDPPGGLSPESYLGYSVTSGRFFDNGDMFYAVGAPRDSNNHGRVYIFKALEQKKNELFIHQKKEGTQFGEYFGASMLGINLNGDAFTDLLVGAPFYSMESGGDEGKVYVYLSNGVGLQTYAELLGGNKPNARFGTTIANLGDLNQDGFNDVAVGAPYEDGTGAVYIYHGSESGMNVQYVQKIEAVSVDPKLSGFGIHVSRGLDIDSNQYPDILVGSYASSNAVLFRTRPVVQLFPKLIFNPKQMNTNFTSCELDGESVPCVNVSACLWYAGKHVPLSLDFENEVFVEHPSQSNMISPRGFFRQNGKHTSMISLDTKLDIGIEKCITKLLYLRPDVKDVITPIQILFRYHLIPPPRADQIFNKSFPVVDPSSPTNITSAITFQTGCGREDKCLSDLEVKAKLLGGAESGQMILGEVSSVSLAIIVKNKGEPAYLSELLIYLPPDMPSINQDFCASSSQRHNASLVCDLGNPLIENREVQILIKLDVTKIPSDKKKLDIFLEALTVSTEIEPSDNTVRIPLHLQAIADIGIAGVSAQEQILYDEPEEGTEDTPIPITHTYTIKNHGPSSLQMIDIVIFVPIAFLNSAGRLPFLTFTNLEADSGKPLTIPAQCNDTYLNLKSVQPEVKTRGQGFGEDEFVAEGNQTRTRYNHSGDFVGRPTDLTLDFEESTLVLQEKEKKNNERSKVTAAKTRETIIVNCENENVECIAIKCSASPFTDIRKVAQIAVSAEINLTALGNYLGPWYRVELITVGRVSMRDTDVEKLDQHPDVAQVKTIFVHKGPPPSEELALWIIFVSIGVGIFLLILILVLLVKFGFFKREQKDKMKEMLNADTKEYDTLNEEAGENDALN